MTPPDHITDPRLRKLWESAYRLEVARLRLEQARRDRELVEALEAVYREGPADPEEPDRQAGKRK